MSVNKYDKYIDLEFSYFHEGDHILLVYNGYQDIGDICAKCEKKRKMLHSFTQQNGYGFEEWLFGNECVKNVFGVGLTKVK